MYKRQTLDRLAEELLEHETLGKEELAVIFDGLEPWLRSDLPGEAVVDLRVRRDAPVEADDVPAPEWDARDVDLLAGAGGPRAAEHPAPTDVRPPKNTLPGTWDDGPTPPATN